MKNKKNTKDSQEKKSQDILRDYKKSGKLRPWKKRKAQSEAIAKAFLQMPGYEKYGERMLGCCNYTKFEECKEVLHGKKLIGASFCNCRSCITCQSRNAENIRREVFDVVGAHLDQYPDHVPIFLTTTTPNVEGELLGKEIDKLNSGWKRMSERKVVKAMNEASFKALEISFNSDREDFHPHFHTLIMVRPDYFHPNSPLYITHEQWLKLWQEGMRDSTITQVNVQAIKDTGEGTLAAIVAEIAKYTTKPSSYVFKNQGNFEVNEFALGHIQNALHNRRTIGYGGNFRKIRTALNKEKEIKAAELKSAEEVQVNEGGTPREKPVSCCNVCKKPMTTVCYLWHPILKNYFKVPPQERPTYESYRAGLDTVQCRGPT